MGVELVLTFLALTTCLMARKTMQWGAGCGNDVNVLRTFLHV